MNISFVYPNALWLLLLLPLTIGLALIGGRRPSRARFWSGLFFGDPGQMAAVLPTMGLGLVFAGLGAVPRALMERAFRFGALAWVNLFALTLPWAEFFCAVLLLSGQWVRTSSLMVFGLLIVFMVAASFNMVRGLDVDSGI